MVTFPARILEFLRGFEASENLLIEWETSLLSCLGYPLVSNGVSQSARRIGFGPTTAGRIFFFLTPDDQLETARGIAAELGLDEADEEQLRPAYTSELSGPGVCYTIEESDDDPFRNPFRLRRLVLLPLSWAGMTHQERTRSHHPTLNYHVLFGRCPFV